MKILNICQKDFAGVGIKLTEAVNAHTGHKARHLCMESHHFRYKVDICVKDPKELRRWILWADVVNCHVYPRPLARADTRPRALIMTQHGSYFRRKSEKCHDHNRKWGVKKTLCTTPDLTKFGAEWLPTAIPMNRYAAMRRKHDGFPVICQTPSNPKKKNTGDIWALLSGNSTMRLVLAHHMLHDEALYVKARADIFIDRFKLGLGVSGLEAAAMGIPVIADASPEDEALIIGEVGYLPYYKSSLMGLGAAIDALLSSEGVYREYAERGRCYIRDIHNYPVVAERYVAICEEVLNG